MKDIFAIGETFPHEDHKKRVDRYHTNKHVFLGDHYEVFERRLSQMTGRQQNTIYISSNIAGIICKKSADFLFGEAPVYSAGKADDSPEQKALERLVNDNDLNIINYESALSNAYRGDSFYKIRWGQEYGGILPEDFDPFKVIIESQNANYVFPQESPVDAHKIICYHVAYPECIDLEYGDDWILHIESHYPGYIHQRDMRMNATRYDPITGEANEWKIYAYIEGTEQTIPTGVPHPLVVHVPNYGLDDTWEGVDDLTEHHGIFDEINNRLSKIAEILDKHADPAMVVPVGSLEEDENGQPIFHAGRDKIFEIMDKNDVPPQYITWNGQLQACFQELDLLVDQLLMNCEIPPVALGKDNSGTSGASGIAVKMRMNSLLAKINRKRQYYDKALKRVLYIAQLLEQAQSTIGYEPTVPHITFKDGLPNDDSELANIASIRTGGKPTLSQLSAIMSLNGCTEEQARIEIERIDEEEKAASFVDGSIFNEPDTEPQEEDVGGDS